MKKILTTVAVMSLFATPAWAASFQLNSLTIEILNPLPATLPLPLTLTQAVATPYNFVLNEGESTASIALINWLTPGDNKYAFNFTADVRLTFNMTLPSDPTNPVDVGAATRMDVSGNNNDTFTITFADPVSAYWGYLNTGRLDIDLSNVSAIIHNGDSGDSGQIFGVFTYVNEPDSDPNADPFAVAAVPEPSTLLLLGTGLVLAARGLRRRA